MRSHSNYLLLSLNQEQKFNQHILEEQNPACAESLRYIKQKISYYNTRSAISIIVKFSIVMY